MCNFTCSIITSVIGAALVVAVSVVTFVVVPGVVENIIEREMTLIDDTIQFERFEEVPVLYNFSVRVWSISNRAEVLNGGVPIMVERGPYIYRMQQLRVLENVEDDQLTYRIVDEFTFDANASYPNTEDDMVTIANIPYNAILQVAESLFPFLMGALNAGLSGIFAEHNSPITEVRIKDLLFDGIPICQNPGLIGAIACSQVRSLGQESQNLVELEDGSLLFSLLSHRNNTPSSEYVVNRGLTDSADLGRIISYNQLPHLQYWANTEGVEVSRCNMINGTDSGIYAPFVDTDTSIFALNTDICRSVELRYQFDIDYSGIPAVRYSINEWFLANEERCFCLNVTTGLTHDDGCLLQGAMELYSCVGAFLVLSYPHFLYADFRYRNGVLGMNPNEDIHRIFVDLEPNTGTVMRGMKRGQFNVFLRPLTGIPATQNLRTTLTPVFWVEEGMALPQEFVDEIRSRLLLPLTLVDILLPVLIALCALVLLLGIIFVVRARKQTARKTATLGQGQARGTTSNM